LTTASNLKENADGTVWRLAARMVRRRNLRALLREDKTSFEFAGDYRRAARCCLRLARLCVHDGDELGEFLALREAYVCMFLTERFDETAKRRVLNRMTKLEPRVFSTVNTCVHVPLLCDFALCCMLARETEKAHDCLRTATLLLTTCVHPGIQDYVTFLNRTLERDVEYVKKRVRNSPYLNETSPVARAVEKLVTEAPANR